MREESGIEPRTQPRYRGAETRSLGRSAVPVSLMGLGTAALGGLYEHVDEADAHAVVCRAHEAGLRYVDTAPQYGHGSAERRTGAVLRDLDRDAFTVSTKVGRLVVMRPGAAGGIFADAPPSDTVFDFSRDGVLRSLESSLDRMGLDRVDIVYLHDPDDFEDQALTIAYPALHELRSEGVVRAIGVGMNQSRIPTRFAHETDIDAVLLAGRYTLLDRSGADLLAAAAERRVSVVIGGVYNSGVLANPHRGAHYDYAPAARPVLQRVRRLAAVCARHDVPLKAAAVQFPLSHPAVVSVLAGVRSVVELDENLAALDHKIPPPLWDDLVAEGLLEAECSPRVLA